MKKTIALLIGALLLLTGVFAACSTSVTSKTVRWEDNESYTFNITLADFTDSNSGTFNPYDCTVKKEDNTDATIVCYKDLGTTQEAAMFSSYDQICPVDVKGTYTMNLSLDTTTSRKLETKQVIYSQYETAVLELLGCLNTLKAYVVSGADNPFENNEGRTTLRSETTSVVVFSNDADQLPVSSVKENKGFYIGKLHQGVSDYKYETTYDVANRKVSVKKDGGEAVERKLGIAKGGSCIDAGQVLLYLRSLDKSSNAFADTPSVAVYDPVTNTVANAMFSLERNFYAVLNNGGSNFYASVHAAYVTVGGRPFLAEFNLPNLTEEGEDKQSFDFIPATGAGKTCKYTTIKFRSGWYSYELSEYNADVLSAIDLHNKTFK